MLIRVRQKEITTSWFWEGNSKIPKSFYLYRSFCTPLKIKNSCASTDNGTTMTSINSQVTNGTKLEFDQFAFISTSSGILLRFWTKKTLISGTTYTCEADWTLFVIDVKNKCFRNYGNNFILRAAPYCESQSSRLPLPTGGLEIKFSCRRPFFVIAAKYHFFPFLQLNIEFAANGFSI